jgi:hypothetical protein
MPYIGLLKTYLSGKKALISKVKKNRMLEEFSHWIKGKPPDAV